jgi:hypothetical protein
MPAEYGLNLLQVGQNGDDRYKGGEMVIEERAWRMRSASTCSRLEPGEKYTYRKPATDRAGTAP